MAKGDPAGLYTPQTLDGTSLSALALSVERELQRIAASSEIALVRQLEFLHSAPPRPREGMITGADGVDWNPGLGQGVYIYIGSAWQLLFAGATAPGVASSTIGKVEVLTQAEYDALSPPEATTLYFVLQ